MSIYEMIGQFIIAAMTSIFILDVVMLFFGWRLWKHRQARKARKRMGRSLGEIVAVENTPDGPRAVFKLNDEGMRLVKKGEIKGISIEGDKEWIA